METKILDITPSWISLLDALVDLTQSRNTEARKVAYEELRRMAKAADLYNEIVKKEAR